MNYLLAAHGSPRDGHMDQSAAGTFCKSHILRGFISSLIQRLALIYCAVLFTASASQAQTITPVGSGFNSPQAIALDSQANLFLSDINAIKKVTAGSGYAMVTTLGNGFLPPLSVAVDKSGNLFACDGKVVKEILVADGYETIRTIGSGFVNPVSVALDASGNLFVADAGTNQVIELLASGGYATSKSIGTGFSKPSGVSIDSARDIIVADTGNSAVKMVPASDGYTTIKVLVADLYHPPTSAAMDRRGDLFVADSAAVSEYTPSNGYAFEQFVLVPQSPLTIALDDQDNLFVACATSLTGNNFGSIGEVSAASGYTNYTTLDLLFSPIAITLDTSSNIYFVESGDSAITEISAASGYAKFQLLVDGTDDPEGLAVDKIGNVFFVTNGALQELPIADGYTTVKIIAQQDFVPSTLAIDGNGNIFVAEYASGSVVEFVAASGYATVNMLNHSFSGPSGIAADSQGNLFILDSTGLNEVLAAGGYSTVKPIGHASKYSGIAIDGQNNLFLANGQNKLFLTNGRVMEALAAGGYTTIFDYLGGDISSSAIASDAAGHLFAISGSNVEEVGPDTPSPIAAALLPIARSPSQSGTATVFASMINTSSSPLENCSVSLPARAPGGLTMSYQTTDPATNALTGTPNMPTIIPGNNGLATFLLAFRDPTLQLGDLVNLNFACDGAAPAIPIAGVNSLYLSFGAYASSADIIAIAATPSDDGIVKVPEGGAAAFSVASTNVGSDQSFAVTVDTGTTILPITANICQTDRTTGQCIASPAPSVAMDFQAGATATFSVFLQSSAPIALAPSYARVFVRFGSVTATAPLGATSVAVQSP